MQTGSITFRFLNFGYRNKPELYTQIKAFWTINQDFKKTCTVGFFMGCLYYMQTGSITFRFINFGYRNKPELYTQIKAFWTINQDLKKKNLHCRFFFMIF